MATFEMNFKDNTKDLYSIKLNENISMILKKISDSVAIIFFICDIENNKINIPEGLIIYDNTIPSTKIFCTSIKNVFVCLRGSQTTMIRFDIL